MELYCKTCNQKLTVLELHPVSSDEANWEDKAPLIGPGCYLNANETDIHFEKQIDFLVNQQSVVLHDHPDRSRLTGCCGPGDLSVLNQVCPKCRAEIGVIVADCWLPHFVGISGETVSEEPLW